MFRNFEDPDGPNESNNFQRLIKDSTEYADERMRLVMLGALDKAAKAIANSTAFLLTVILSGFVIGFICIALAILIGQQLSDLSLGFLIMGGLFLILVILSWINRYRWIGIPVMNAFLKSITGDDED